MIRRLQLRGISRTPSDRLTEDGGCAESLNVHLGENEIAPTLKPTVVNEMTDERGVRMFPDATYSTLPWDAVFIHKTPYFTRAIIKYEQGGSTKIGVWNGTSFSSFLTLESGETFVRCVGLGNTLGVATNQSVHWVLMKDGAYSYIGTKIPFPEFVIANKEIPASDEEGEEVVRQILYVKQSGSPQASTGFDNDHLSELWEKIDEAVVKNRAQGVYSYQRFAILAVKLFDGTRIISTPVLLSPGFEQPFTISYEYIIQSNFDEKITVDFNTAYKIFLKIGEPDNFFSSWKGIVESIEVYLSPQIAANIDRTDSRFENYESDGEGASLLVTGDLILGSDSYSYLEQYLDASNFYRVYTAGLDDENMQILGDGIILDTKQYMTGETLATSGLRLNTLSDMNHYEVSFDRATLFNSEIITSGISEKVELSLGMPFATHYYDPEVEDSFQPDYTPDYTADDRLLKYKMTFHLRDSSGKEFTIKATQGQNGFFLFGPTVLDSISGVLSNAYGLIFCPDPRAFSVDIQATLVSGDPGEEEETITTVTLPMTEHPNLSCSYWYGGVDKELLSLVTGSSAYVEGNTSYIDKKPNKIYVSEMDNPFVFPIGSRYTLNSKVIGHAIATDALSTGQFGQFPVYVFTEEGIWAMETAADGTFVSTKPLSREVCTNPDSITTIDNAVVFITAKAVMLISGSQITDLSPNMNGRHFALDPNSDEYRLISEGNWGEFIDVLKDDTHFLSYMSGAHIAYDYTGNRLLFINEEEEYQYVFMLKTQTWHKIFPDGYSSVPGLGRVLNAYPDSYVNAYITHVEDNVETEYHQIWNLSTVLDVASEENLKGIIITRPFDLGEPDIRKTIKSIRIRGQYNRKDVRYILLGSFDGISWMRLPSLRGGSYKLFRMIILTNLSPTERISWIDIDYESRFATKLR